MNISLGLNFSSVGALASSVHKALTAIAAGWNIEHRIDGRHKLPWITPEFNAAFFEATSGTWTVEKADVVSWKYWLVDETLVLNFSLKNTTLSAVNGALFIRLPDGHRVKAASFEHVTTCHIVNNSVRMLGIVSTSSAFRDYLIVQAIDMTTGAVANFAAAQTSIQGQITIEVEPQ